MEGLLWPSYSDDVTPRVAIIWSQCNGYLR